jgi:hypothetical protein
MNCNLHPFACISSHRNGRLIGPGPLKADEIFYSDDAFLAITLGASAN